MLKGFKPADVSNYFKNNLISLLDRTLSTAKVEMNQIGLICYTKGPGIGTCLDLVATFAKTIAYLSKLPIVGVNHCVARNFILEKNQKQTCAELNLNKIIKTLKFSV